MQCVLILLMCFFTLLRFVRSALQSSLNHLHLGSRESNCERRREEVWTEQRQSDVYINSYKYLETLAGVSGCSHQPGHMKSFLLPSLH